MIRSSRLVLFTVTLWMVAVSARAQAPHATSVSVDYIAVSRDIHGFEAIVNKALSTAFNGAPFAVSQQTKGVYLQGYGATFSFVINIHRALVTPFGVVQGPGDDITPEQKRRRIEELKERLSRVLLDNGSNLRQLRPGDAITIVGFFEDRNFPDEPNQNKTVVLSVLKKELDGIPRGDDRWREFKLRVKSVEY